MGSYSLASMYHTHRSGGDVTTTIVTQPKSVVQTISSTQLEAKSAPEPLAIIHQNNSFLPKQEFAVLSITTNHLDSEKPLEIKCAKHDCLQVGEFVEVTFRPYLHLFSQLF